MSGHYFQGGDSTGKSDVCKKKSMQLCMYICCTCIIYMYMHIQSIVYCKLCVSMQHALTPQWKTTVQWDTNVHIKIWVRGGHCSGRSHPHSLTVGINDALMAHAIRLGGHRLDSQTQEILPE